mmetsp:Transcript_18830/g.45144  ORF Transcript_18830/g.45144 Transcript_18830/m.45144 type:complete len:154 (+) Transcript_18830:723-1184(+)
MPATRSGAGTPGEASAALSDGVAWVLFVLRPQRAGAQLGPRSSQRHRTRQSCYWSTSYEAACSEKRSFEVRATFKLKSLRFPTSIPRKISSLQPLLARTPSANSSLPAPVPAQPPASNTPGIAVHATLEHKDDPGDDEEKEKVEYCEDDEGGA